MCSGCSLEGENKNWDRTEGKWKQLMGSTRACWDKLAHAGWNTISGKKDRSGGQIQKRCSAEGRKPKDSCPEVAYSKASQA
jgi:uncharacterized protein YjbJ (UPF0337 family)